MPVYQYKGQYYELSETDPAAAKAKILSHLGEQAPAAPASPPQTLAAQAGLDQRPSTPAGFMLRPEFVEQVRSEYGNLPPEQRRAALQEASMGRGVRADAAKRILADLAIEDQRRREMTQGREGLMSILAAAQQQPAPRRPAAPAAPTTPARVEFPDVSPTIGDIMDMVPERERIQRRLAQDEAARTLEAAESSIEATRAREQERMGGVEQLIESLKIGGEQAKSGALGLTAVAQQAQMAKVGDQLKELEAQGQGNTPQADRLRKVLEHYSKRQQVYLGDLAQTQAKLSTAPVYKGVRELTEAETFTDAAKAFARNPISIVANLTAQSLPSMLPALVLGVINPALGVAAMGGSSYGVEFGNELLGFAREKGFDTTDPKQMAQFMQNSELLREGVNRAGTKAGIVAAGDMLLTGLASKTLVPKRITGPVAKNVTNVGVQMGVQGVGGAGTEALSQLATTGEIKPGEVVAEAVGELGGAPAEVLSQTAQARREARAAQQAAAPTAEPPAAPPAAAPAAPVPPAPPAAPAVEPERVAGLFEQLAKESQLPIAEESRKNMKLEPDEPVQDVATEALKTEPTPPQTELPSQAVVEVPVNQLKLSEDVPQFKAGADKAGIVEPLGGKFERTGVAPIQVWRRTDGRMEIISGRHRFDLAKRSGEKTIPAQIHDESKGFTRDMAAVLDAELNIRDGQGKVKDYVNYFKGTGLDRETADARGLLARAPGKRAYAIAIDGSDELIAAIRADQISDEAAYLIGINAPKDARLQSVGIKAVADGKSAATAVNMMQAVRALAGEADTTTDMFGFDDSAIKEAEEMAKIAGRKQREIQTRLSAISGAARNPQLAASEGIDIRDPQAVNNRINELRQMKASWDNWSTNPQLVAEVRAERGVAPPVLTTQTPEELRAKAEREERARKEEQAKPAEVPPAEEFVLTGSERAADEAAARGQMELTPPAEEKIEPKPEDLIATPISERFQKPTAIPGARKSNKELMMAVEDNDWGRTTEQLINSKNPIISAVGKLAEKLPFIFTEINPRVFVGKNKAASAGYAPENGGIYVKSKAAAANEHVIAHEIVHALTIDAIRNPTEKQKPAVKRLENLYQYVKRRLGRSGQAMYGLTNIEEFIAEGNSNPEFQKVLSTIPYQRQTAWGAFTKAIADILGIKDSNALMEIIAINEELATTESQRGEYEAGEIVAIKGPRSIKERLRDNWVVSKDELGRTRFTPGAVAYKAAATLANNVLDRVGMKPISPELGRAMRNMRVQVENVQKKTANLAQELAKMSPQEREMISDVIEGELKAGVQPPENVLNIAASMQELMKRQSDELVRLGMLSKESAQRWEYKYLPRFYLSKLKDDVNAWAKAAKNLIRRQPTMQGVVGKNLKARGLFETIPVEDLQDWIDLGYEQRDPSFDPKTSTETVVWRDYTREERENMGEIRDAMFRFVMGYNASQRDIALGRLYEELADSYASKGPKEGFVQVPDTKVEGTGAYRYGKLAGMYVPKEIMDHLVHNDQELANGVLKIYRAALSRWKEGKTVLNPVAHANNVISNLTMAHFAGVSYWDVQKYAGAVKDMATNSDLLKEADEVGLFSGSFSQSELVASMPPELQAMANMTESQIAKLGGRIWDLLSYTVEHKGRKIGVRPVAQWMYENEDSFFRFLIYRDARNRGLDPQDARDYSQSFIFTYDDLPRGARALRDFAMPFFAYTYKVIPVLARTALEYPWRYAAPASIAYSVNAMMYAMAAGLGEDEDDWWGNVLYKYATDPEFRAKAKELEQQERRNLPPWLKGESAALGAPKAIRLGMDDVTGMPLFIDTSRIFPGADLLDAVNNSGGVALLQPLTPSNPVLTTLVAMLANKDMFFGKDVVKASDTEEEKAQKRLAWLWKQATPAIAVGNYHFDRGMNVIANITGKPITIDAGPMGVVDYTGVGKDGLPVIPKYAALQTVGVKVRPYDLEVSEKIEESKQNQLIRELALEISRIDRLEKKGAISTEAAVLLKSKAEEKQRLLKDGLDVEGKPRE